jgi:tyrosine-protein phosphatase SIW14
MADFLATGRVSTLFGGCCVLHHYVCFRGHLAGLIITAAIANPVFAKDPKAGATPAAVATAAVRIDNFGRVNEHFYRGARPTEQDLADLAKFGVKTTIDLTNGDGDSNEQRLAEGAGLKFFKIAMNTRVVPTAEQIATFLKIVNDPDNQPVYVHCVGGRHRTGVMTAIYRMTQENWTAAQAFQEMKTYKFGADFLHPEFKKFVLAFKPALFGVPVLPSAPAVK